MVATNQFLDRAPGETAGFTRIDTLVLWQVAKKLFGRESSRMHQK